MKRIQWLSGAAAFCLLLGACGKEETTESIPFPPLTPFSPELSVTIEQIRSDTADLRELVRRELREQGTLTREQLRAHYDAVEAAVSDKDKQDVEHSSMALRLLHMMSDEEDLLDVTLEQQSEDIAGFYVPWEEKMVLVGSPTSISLTDELILSHEFVHSLQQPWFDDQQLIDLAENDLTEYSNTIDCVIEGDATVTAELYMIKKYGPAWRDQVVREETSEPAGDQSSPTAMDRYFMMNYSECPAFVFAVLLQRGWDGVNGLHDRPPATTEQILHPERYFANEGPRSLRIVDLEKSLGSGWKQFMQVSFGEFDVYNYIATISGDETLGRAAAEGWGAGWMTLYHLKGKGDDAEYALHVSLQMDNASQLEEFKAAYAAGLTTLSLLTAQPGPEETEWTWESADEHGHVIWTPSAERVDILIATTKGAIDKAKPGLLTALK